MNSTEIRLFEIRDQPQITKTSGQAISIQYRKISRYLFAKFAKDFKLIQYFKEIDEDIKKGNNNNKNPTTDLKIQKLITEKT